MTNKHHRVTSIQLRCPHCNEFFPSEFRGELEVPCLTKNDEWVWERDLEIKARDFEKEVNDMFSKAKKKGDGTLSLSPEYREKLDHKRKKKDDQ